MKKLIIAVYTMCYRILKSVNKSVRISNSKLLFIKTDIGVSNKLVIENSVIKRTSINVQGDHNEVIIKGAIGSSKIHVKGKNNTIKIDEGCGVENTVVVVNGVNCKVVIGKRTSVGSMYMVCMGTENYIVIGEECMIADRVEIWATDSHPIFDESGKICNPSKPIKIGNHVWLGKCAKVLKGVTIHDNAIIGMDALIKKEIPANSLVVGSDGRIIKSNVNWNRTFIKV